MLATQCCAASETTLNNARMVREHFKADTRQPVPAAWQKLITVDLDVGWLELRSAVRLSNVWTHGLYPEECASARFTAHGSGLR